MNLLEAISLAGGPADFANLDNISILRKTPTGVTTIRTKLAGVLKNGVTDKLAGQAIPVIQTGDTVIVP